MNNFVNSHLGWFRRLIKHGKSKPEVTSNAPAFEKGITDLDNVVTSIVSELKIQEQTSKPETRDKRTKRFKLCDMIFVVISPTFSYAYDIKNENLKELCKTPISDLQQLCDEDIMVKAETVIEKITPLVTDDLLNEYGVKTENVNNISTALTDFKAVVSNPQTKISERHSATNHLKTLVKNGSEIVENKLDRVVIAFKTINPKFYYRYWNLHNLIPRGKGVQMGASIMVIDSTVNEVIQGQEVQLSTQEIGVNPIAYTNKNGIAFFHCKTPQTCTYTIPGDFTEPVTGTVTIEKDKITYIEVYVTPK